MTASNQIEEEYQREENNSQKGDDIMVSVQSNSNTKTQRSVPSHIEIVAAATPVPKPTAMARDGSMPLLENDSDSS